MRNIEHVILMKRIETKAKPFGIGAALIATTMMVLSEVRTYDPRLDDAIICDEDELEPVSVYLIIYSIELMKIIDFYYI
jgi:hypothetical protein